MTPGQFAHHKLEPGDKYGFDEFRSSKKFKDTTKPIKPVARIGDSKKRSAKKSVVTARGGSAFGSNKPSTPMDESFAKDLRDIIGVRGIEKPNIHFIDGLLVPVWIPDKDFRQRPPSHVVPRSFKRQPGKLFDGDLRHDISHLRCPNRRNGVVD